MHEQLQTWRRGACLSAASYQCFAASKKLGLRDRITRCGLSVRSNIAEGFGRACDAEKPKLPT